MIARSHREVVVTALLLAPLGACTLNASGIASGDAGGSTTTSGTGGAGGAAAAGAGGEGGAGGGGPSSGITEMRVKMAITHARLGNLTVKLTSPAGMTQTLMSRPGFYEVADDGSSAGETVPPKNYGSAGDLSDLFGSDPITFDDIATTDAEDMGLYLDGETTGVCRDPDNMANGSGAAICRYHPSPQSAGGPASFSAAFAGQPRAGAWRLCVGDSHGETIGSLDVWQIEIATVEQPEEQFTGIGVSKWIPDGGYNGGVDTMACDSIEVP